MSLRDTFLAGIKRRQSIHTLPDGTTMPICELSADEYFACVEAGSADADTKRYTNVPAFYAAIVRYGACDDTGAPLFTDDDLPQLERARNPLSEPSWLYGAGDAIWALSEVRQTDLKSDDPETDQARGTQEQGTGED